MPASVSVFAPASIGNLAVGFDMLGLAIEGVGDTVTARRSAAPGVSIVNALDADGRRHPSLPLDAGRNTAAIAAQSFWDAHGDEGGIELSVRKGIPMRSGMGGSAASAVAGVVAANALLDKPLEAERLLPYALEGERFASGSLHADNVAPSLLGGLVLCPTALLPRAVRIPVPAGLRSILLHPNLEVDTGESRQRLDKTIPVERWLEQQGYLAAFIAACSQGDKALMAASLKDVVIEPQRAASVPCFDAVRKAAIEAGAFGCSLSGSGPGLFALADDGIADSAAAAMRKACTDSGHECEVWVSSLNAAGARVVDA